jgi:outer membrane biosynthesis protein TonB
VDTGARGQGTGLTFGGGGTGGVTNLDNFCCKEYLDALLAIINGNWRSQQPDARGTTILKFTIRRDGTIDLGTIEIERSSGSRLLDRVAQGALVESNDRLRNLPLPARYTEPVLTVHLQFPYGSS